MWCLQTWRPLHPSAPKGASHDPSSLADPQYATFPLRLANTDVLRQDYCMQMAPMQAASASPSIARSTTRPWRTSETCWTSTHSSLRTAVRVLQSRWVNFKVGFEGAEKGPKGPAVATSAAAAWLRDIAERAACLKHAWELPAIHCGGSRLQHNSAVHQK